MIPPVNIAEVAARILRDPDADGDMKAVAASALTQAQRGKSNDRTVTWPGVTRLDLPPERVLGAAADACPEHVVVLGWDAEGEFYATSTFADGAELLWLLEIAKAKLLKIGMSED